MLLKVPDPTTPGQRIKAARLAKGWSIRHAAAVAGMDHTHWSKIERGLCGADKQPVMHKIATTLGVSGSELYGMPYVPGDRHVAKGQTFAPIVGRTLQDTGLDAPNGPPDRPIAELERAVDILRGLRANTDYAGAAVMLPDVLLDLHNHAHGPHRHRALQLLVHACYVATFALRSLGFPDAGWIAGQRALLAAQELDEVPAIGIGMFASAHACAQNGAYHRALVIAGRAIDDLQRHTSVPGALELLGMHTLTAALCSVGVGDVGASDNYLAEADDLAARTGDTDDELGMLFGPTNAGIWRMGILVESDRGEQVPDVAARIRPGHLTKSRQAEYHIDCARGWVTRGRAYHDHALRQLIAAERFAPQHVLTSPTARESTRWLLADARRRAGGDMLRGLAERMDVAAKI